MGGWDAYKDDDAAPAEAVVEADGEDLGEDDGCGEVVELCLRFLSVNCLGEEGFEVGSYVAVEALVCALLDLGGKGEGGGTGGQAEDVGVGLHGEDLLAMLRCW